MATEPDADKQPPQEAVYQCWVCFEGPKPDSPLINPCSCPRPAHAECCARWQLHAAGRAEEHFCRFCQQKLPDWQCILTPSEAHLPAQCLPTMSVTFNDRQHHIVAQSGPEGYAAFEAEVRRIFCIEADMDMNLIFDCAEPTTGSLLKLNGPGAFNAAVHCAKVSAAKRLRRCQMQRKSQDFFSDPNAPHLDLEDPTSSNEQVGAVSGPCPEAAAQTASVQPEVCTLPKVAQMPSEERLAAARAAAFSRASLPSRPSLPGCRSAACSGPPLRLASRSGDSFGAGSHVSCPFSSSFGSASLSSGSGVSSPSSASFLSRSPSSSSGSAPNGSPPSFGSASTHSSSSPLSRLQTAIPDTNSKAYAQLAPFAPAPPSQDSLIPIMRSLSSEPARAMAPMSPFLAASSTAAPMWADQPSAQGQQSSMEGHAQALESPPAPVQRRLTASFPRIRRYRNGRRIISGLSSNAPAHARGSAPPRDLPVRHQARPRTSAVTDLLEAFCRALSSPRRAGLEAPSRDGVSYPPDRPRETVYYNSSFQPQEVPDPTSGQLPTSSQGEREPELPSQASSTSLQSDTSAFKI